MKDLRKWVPESMPYDLESRKNFKPSVKPYDVAALLDRVPTYKKGPKAQPNPDVTDEKDIYEVICVVNQRNGTLFKPNTLA